MHSDFPKTLTIQLPELQREALKEIHRREPGRSPARLLEALLAVGVASKLGDYLDTLEEPLSADDECDCVVTHESRSSEPTCVRLNSAQTARVYRIVDGGTHRTAEEVAVWMLEWGLDAYEESLRFVVPTDTESTEEAR